MNRTDLLALAARVEAAQGADRALDADVFAAAHPRMKRHDLHPEVFEDGDWIRTPPAYTASLDAALTPPAGWVCRIETKGAANGTAWVRLTKGQRHAVEAKAVGEARARTVAALRAMAEEIKS